MSDLAKRIAALSPEQRALFELRLKQKGLSTKQTPSILPRTKTDFLPLSLAQERLWLLHQLQPDIPLYNESSLFRLTGKLNVTALEQSINAVIQRHEILRTCFQVVVDQPVQVIDATLTFSLPLVDLQGIPETEQQAKVKQIVTTDSSIPFDLSQGQLLRGTLLRLKQQEYILLLTMHHIISDGWSWKVFYQELAVFYSATANDLPKLPIQYADFALWQREWLQSETIKTQLAYWKQQLEGIPPVLPLPTDYPRPANQSFRGAREQLILPLQLTNALKSLSQQSGVTLFMTLLAALTTLLYRYTGQTDIPIGTPVANRTCREIEGLIGCFINTLVLRTDLTGEISFCDLLRRVRDRTLAAYAHQDLLFEQLVKELQPERTMSYAPLFQVMFVFQDAPLQALKLPEIELQPLVIDSGIAKYDLTLFLEDTKQGLIGALEYNTDLFKADTITRMLGHFQTLLEKIVSNPQQQLWQLPLLTLSEQQQLAAGNHTQINYPQLCLHQLFEAQVEQTPDAVAVEFESAQLTYRELNASANQLAHYLRQLGLQPEGLVGVCVERSLEMVVALLAILKAGGAYVPLDPTYPPERLSFILEDTQVQVLLTQQHLVEVLPAHPAELVCLDADSQTIAQHSTENPINTVVADNLAYVIYTSGSTGKPKGVQILHRAVVNFLCSMHQQLEVTAPDVFLAVTTITFDIAVLELFLPLTIGSRVVVASREVATDGVRLSESLNNSGATVMQATPATWRMLITADWQGNNQLKILSGGEALSPQLAEQLLGWSKQFWNLYGPTETTIWSTLTQIESKQQPVTIGRAIANTQTYILDNHLQPVPIGIPGELYIGGIGLARGYLHRPDLTAEKFIPDPFNHAAGTRLYRTGDLARYRADGAIEYIKRSDRQIKLRGFRIELGEIEAVLSQHPTLREVVVILREDQPQQKRLVAYVVPISHREPTPSELRSYLQKRLPAYMVPSVFVVLEALPLTPNGKVNRQALPVPDQTRPELETFVAPRSVVEEMLASIWEQILDIERVSIHDNFFALGGHSLLATQVVSRLRQAFQVSLPLRSVFEAPTVASLALQVEEAMKTEAKLAAPPIQAVSREQALPLSFAQQRLWCLQQLEPETAAYNGCVAVQLQGALNISALEQSLNEIIRRHEVLRTSFTVVDEQLIQAIAPTLTLSLPAINLSELPLSKREQQAQQITIQAAQQAFNLTQAPLLRVSLLRLGEEEHRLLLTMHHIISDAWSAGVIMHEIAALYQAFTQKQPSPLPDLPIQYGDFAVWQRQWLQKEVLEQQLSYWKQQLGTNPPVLKLQNTSDRFSVATAQGARHYFTLSLPLTAALKTLSQQQGVTLFMTLLAAFNLLLCHYTSQEDIIVGSPIANRNRAEIEGLIGFFVNTLVLRTDLSNNPSFAEILARVREVALGAYAHQDLPFEQLVHQLQPERHLTHSPLFQVWFVLQNAPTAELELPGLTLNLSEIETGAVRHDLKLDLTETAAGIQGFFEYKTDLFDAAEIQRLAGVWETLLTTVVEQPEIELKALAAVLAAAQKQQQQAATQALKLMQSQKLGKIRRRTNTEDLSRDNA